jgi:hypothetical protein
MKFKCINVVFRYRENEELFRSLPYEFTNTIIDFMTEKFVEFGREKNHRHLAVHHNVVNTNYEERYFRIEWTSVSDGERTVFGIDMWKEIALDEHLDHLLNEKDTAVNQYVTINPESKSNKHE